ncbi:hypothetical protein DH2020_012202 [Rehmannia glutinosa]|uniref:RNase H type-1 domain-containing protein n=1 Tax=Rehmannia glutinosa TaxID=99300 RepID=A0ABR0WYN0_REHGL
MWDVVSDASPHREQIGSTWNFRRAMFTLVGQIKMNTGVATFKDGSVGYGFVVRNSVGEVIYAGTKRTHMHGSSLGLEGLALQFAIQSSVAKGIGNFQIECDSKGLINCLKDKVEMVIGEDIIVEDIKLLAQTANCHNFIYVPRSVNQLAHEIAHFDPCPSAELFWPDSLERCRQQDPNQSIRPQSQLSRTKVDVRYLI